MTRWGLILLPVLAVGCQDAAAPVVPPPAPEPNPEVTLTLSVEPLDTGALRIVATATNTGNTGLQYLTGCIDFDRDFEFTDPLGNAVTVFTGGGPRPLCPEWREILNPGESTTLMTGFRGVLLDETGPYPARPGRYGVSARFGYGVPELQTGGQVTAETSFAWNPQ